MTQMFSFLDLNTEHMVQKYLCKKCSASYYSNEQKNNIFMKLWINYVAAKLILDLRFHQGNSVRAISEINKNIFGMYSSTGYINNLCSKVSINAKNKMESLKDCEQKNAKVMMYDETFPKSKEDGSTNMGVVNDENGLIRGVAIVKDKKEDTEAIMKKVLSDKYTPQYFLSDYDTTYPVVIKKLLPEIEINKDFVHTVRQIYKDCKTSINRLKVSDVTLKHFTKAEQKRIIDLKKKLMRKQLNKVIRIIIKGFKKKYVSVGTLYIEGGLANLQNLCKKFPSLDSLFNKLEKFITKYLECWNKQMLAYSEKSIPLTSNITESKNSIFKAFSKKAKSYSSKHMENFFNAVALYENFDVKKRGINKGNNAMMRAEIDLKKFGADNFYDAVNLSGLIFGVKYSTEINQLIGNHLEEVA